jgi:hypothetical protein
VASAPGPKGERAVERSEAELPASELGTQRLFRVRYQGRGGGGSLKLVLRLAARDDFQLSASDPLGRAVWTLRARGEETLIIDHRRSEYCETGRSVRVPEAALASLPIEMLPLVLLGYLPVEADGPAEGEIEVRDSTGQRWTARLEEGRPRSWMLWQGEQPSLWWLAQPRGGILSHRSGSQFRWRESVAEPLAEELGTPPPPPEYTRVECDDWSIPELREDQPASAGDRSSQ